MFDWISKNKLPTRAEHFLTKPNNVSKLLATKMHYQAGLHSDQTCTLYPLSTELCVIAECKCQLFLHLSKLLNSAATNKHKSAVYLSNSQRLVIYHSTADTETLLLFTLTSKYSQNSKISHSVHFTLLRPHFWWSVPWNFVTKLSVLGQILKNWYSNRIPNTC